MWWWGIGVVLLMGGVVVGRFLGRTGGIGLLLGRIGLRRVIEQILGGRIRIRRVIVFLSLGLFGPVRNLGRLGGCLGLRMRRA